MTIYRNNSDAYGMPEIVTLADYIELCELCDWEHGEFTEDDDGIYEDGIMIAETV